MYLKNTFLESVKKICADNSIYEDIKACLESVDDNDGIKEDAKLCIETLVEYFDTIRQQMPTRKHLPGITQNIWTAYERLHAYLSDNDMLAETFMRLKQCLNRINMNIQQYNVAGNGMEAILQPWKPNNTFAKQNNWNILIQQDVQRADNEIDSIKDYIELS